ncbi:hypothetical protein HDU84_006335, partial [Entophlyctis sp. JEL0112]
MAFVYHYLIDPATAENSPGDKTEDNSDEGDYSVEYILGHRVDPKRKIIHYLVKWEGYAHNLNSWVPDFDFNDDGNMIETYHNALKASTAKDSSLVQKTPTAAAAAASHTTPAHDTPTSTAGKRKSQSDENNLPSSKKSAKKDGLNSAESVPTGIPVKTETETDYGAFYFFVKYPGRKVRYIWRRAADGEVVAESSIKKAIRVLGSWENYVSRVKRVDNKADPSNTDKMLYRVTVEFKPNALMDPREVYCVVPLGTARQRLPQP